MPVLLLLCGFVLGNYLGKSSMAKGIVEILKKEDSEGKSLKDVIEELSSADDKDEKWELRRGKVRK
jgi:hypothetical protein